MGKRSMISVIVTLHFLKYNVSEFINWAKGSIQAMNGDPDLPVPVVSLVTLNTHVDALQSIANTRVTDKSKPLTNQENAKITICYSDFTYMAGQIQMLANQKIAATGDPQNAYDLINRFGFVYKKTGIKPGREFKVTKIEAPGKASLVCPRAEGQRTAIYLWRVSTNPMSGWSTPIQTFVSKVNLMELNGDTRYYFQYAVLTNVGEGNAIDVNDPQIAWSDPISGLIPA